MGCCLASGIPVGAFGIRIVGYRRGVTVAGSCGVASWKVAVVVGWMPVGE